MAIVVHPPAPSIITPPHLLKKYFLYFKHLFAPSKKNRLQSQPGKHPLKVEVSRHVSHKLDKPAQCLAQPFSSQPTLKLYIVRNTVTNVIDNVCIIDNLIF